MSAAAADAGYASRSRVQADATASLGMTPERFRRGGEGLVLRWGTRETRFGTLLGALGERGLVALHLGDDEAGSLAALRAELPKARLVEAAGGLEDLLVRVADAAGTAVDPALPLDVRGTAFQVRVWEEVRRIPPGETRSYGELAAALGHPKGARAVATAVARNRLALAIPCHRVIGADGALRGYRWGVERKGALLAAERDAADRERER